MATRSSILAWKMPWTEEPGGLQSIESQRVGHDSMIEYACAQAHLCLHICKMWIFNST